MSHFLLGRPLYPTLQAILHYFSPCYFLPVPPTSPPLPHHPPITQILLPSFSIPLTHRSDTHDQLWVWKTDEDSQLYYDNQETVRFKITEEIWTDQTPVGPSQKDDEEALGRDRVSPYSLRASMQDAGLGPCLWWDEDGDGEGEESA
jgi:hypothetical protein